MLHRKYSTYAALIAWGGSAFTSQPSIASGFVHFIFMPVVLSIVIYLAHHEGKDHGKVS